MKIIKNIFLYSLIFFLIFSCEHDFTAISSPEWKIRVTAASEPGLREIYLKVEIRNVSLPQVFSLTRNDSIILQDTLTFTDTTIVDTGLSPATAYNYRAYRLVNGTITDASDILTARTMDTTSHDFNWQIYTIDSPYGSGVLRDVAIINENDIWAAGQIYADSAQPSLPYNAVHWDGQQWELKRIQVFYNGSYITPPLDGIFAFSENDIWVTSGVPKHWNGTTWTQYHLWDMGVLDPDDGGVTKIWGSSPNDIYFVGRKGTIVHYDGSWQKIESGTDLNVNDIWGSFNQSTGEYEILCVASNYLSDPTYSRKILQLEQNQAIDISSYPIQWTLYGVWFIPGRHYYVVGSGIYEKRRLSGISWKNDPLDITPYYIFSMRGSNLNNIIATGGTGELLHFNGISWKSYYNAVGLYYGNYYSVDIKDNLVIAVGEDAPLAVVAVGHK